MGFVKPATWTLALCVLGSTLAFQAQAQDEQVARMRTALAAPARPAEDKERDAVRKPIETVQFLGIKTGQTVIDVIAAGGWFTEVLSAAVGPSGKVLGAESRVLRLAPWFRREREAAQRPARQRQARARRARRERHRRAKRTPRSRR